METEQAVKIPDDALEAVAGGANNNKKSEPVRSDFHIEGKKCCICGKKAKVNAAGLCYECALHNWRRSAG